MHGHTHPQEPNPATAAGVILSLIDGIVLSILNWVAIILFGVVADIQATLGNAGDPAFSTTPIILAWTILYLILGYVLPIIAAYVWAGGVGVGVYTLGWMGTSMVLNPAKAVVGMILLFISIVLILIVGLWKNSRKQRQSVRRGF